AQRRAAPRGVGGGHGRRPGRALASRAPMQPTRPLPDPPPRTASPGARRAAKGIAPGDIVEVDRKGRRFHALVTGIEQLDSGRFELDVRPLDSRLSYRRATVRQVVTVYRRAPSR